MVPAQLRVTRGPPRSAAASNSSHGDGLLKSPDGYEIPDPLQGRDGDIVAVNSDSESDHDKRRQVSWLTSVLQSEFDQGILSLLPEREKWLP